MNLAPLIRHWLAAVGPFPGAVFYLAVAARAEQLTDPHRFEREILVPVSRDAVQMEMRPGGNVLSVEFWAAVKRYGSESGGVSTRGTVTTHEKSEVGLSEIAKARAFEQSRNWRALFCPAEKQETMRVSWLIFGNDVMAASSGQELLSWAYDDVHVFDLGGVMWMDAKDNHDTGNAKGLTDVYAAARWRDPTVVLGLNWIEFRHQLI